jgi:pimeloyl-ACP methyl ester carboxylesterase
LQKLLILFTGCLLLCGCATTSHKSLEEKPAASLAYNYPINNPYVATIIGTPADLRKSYPDVPRTTEKHLVVFKDRKIPEGFWYQSEFRYGELLQAHAAPIIYIIAGTGADYRSAYSRHLGEAFYTAGFHVVMLPSTTHQNFIITASENFIPGRPAQSAKDLYRVMKMIDAQIAAKFPITNHYLTGYSLGGMDAAYTAYLDESQKAFNFRKVMLIDPPYSLFTSIQKIDKMLYQGLPGGLNGVDKFIDTEMSRLASASPTGDPFDFQNAQLLVKAYSDYPPGDERLATTIGLAFRLFAANMMFTSDVMAHTGYIFPNNIELTTGTPLNDYMTVAMRTSLMNYFNDVYLKNYLGNEKQLTKEALISETSLESISSYLSNNPKIGMIANKDDVVLSPGEADRMKTIFGNNAKIYPNGGHLGNLMYPPVTNDILNFIQSGEQK